jgi:hypothetical protein
VGDGPPADMQTVFWRARVDQELTTSNDIPPLTTVTCQGGARALQRHGAAGRVMGCGEGFPAVASAPGCEKLGLFPCPHPSQ